MSSEDPEEIIRPKDVQAKFIPLGKTQLAELVKAGHLKAVPLSPGGRAKTQLLATVSLLVPKPLSAANITAATVFRAVEFCRPTLLIDEVDTFLSDSDIELKGAEIVANPMKGKEKGGQGGTPNESSGDRD